MLLLAVSSTTKGAYGVRHMQGGIAATLDCLENCVAGVLSKDKVRDLLATLEESKLSLVLQDQAANGTIRLQLPFKGGLVMHSGSSFKITTENILGIRCLPRMGASPTSWYILNFLINFLWFCSAYFSDYS